MQKFNFEWGEMINLNKYIYIYKQKGVTCFAFLFLLFKFWQLTTLNVHHMYRIKRLSVAESICQLEVNPVLSTFPSLVDLLAICSVAAVHEFYMYS